MTNLSNKYVIKYISDEMASDITKENVFLESSYQNIISLRLCIFTWSFCKYLI